MIKLIPKLDDLELSAFLKDWIPDKIIDAHVHIHKNFGQSLFNPKAQNPGQTFNWFDLGAHEFIFNKLGISVSDYRAIVFGLPFSDYEEDNNNYLHDYFLDNPRIYSIPCLTHKIALKQTSELDCSFGLKTKIRTKTKNSTNEIINNFSEELWQKLNSAGSFLIIHLPKNIYDNADELIFLANKYKKINFIVAHLGGFYIFDDRLSLALHKIKPCNNIFFDTAMVTDTKVIYSAVTIIGCHRVLFGSDAPFGYFKGGFYKSNGGVIFKPNCNWPWINHAFDLSSLPVINTMVCLQSIVAIKTALEESNQDTHDNRNLIFFDNSFKLIKER